MFTIKRTKHRGDPTNLYFWVFEADGLPIVCQEGFSLSYQQSKKNALLFADTITQSAIELNESQYWKNKRKKQLK